MLPNVKDGLSMTWRANIFWKARMLHKVVIVARSWYCITLTATSRPFQIISFDDHGVNS